MKSYLLIIILAFSLLSGCRAKRVVVSESSETQTAVRMSEVEAIAHQEQSTRLEEIFSTATMAEEIELTQTRTLYSQPDSTGKQYPVEITQTRLTNRKSSQSTNQSINQTVVDISDTTSTLSNQSIIQSSNQSQSTKETPRGQAWKISASIIISFGVVLISFLLLRRFGLIKSIGLIKHIWQ